MRNQFSHGARDSTSRRQLRDSVAVGSSWLPVTQQRSHRGAVAMFAELPNHVRVGLETMASKPSHISCARVRDTRGHVLLLQEGWSQLCSHVTRRVFQQAMQVQLAMSYGLVNGDWPSSRLCRKRNSHVLFLQQIPVSSRHKAALRKCLVTVAHGVVFTVFTAAVTASPSTHFDANNNSGSAAFRSRATVVPVTRALPCRHRPRKQQHKSSRPLYKQQR